MISKKLLLGAGVAVAGYFAFLYKAPRFLGDKARVGDDAFVPVGLVPPIQGIPTGVTLVMVHVTNADADVLNGPITGFVLGNAPAFTPLPVPSAAIPIARSSVSRLSRNGSTVT